MAVLDLPWWYVPAGFAAFGLWAVLSAVLMAFTTRF